MLGFALLCALPAAEVTPRMLLLDGVLVGPDAIAVGERGALLHSPDQGATWQSVPCPTRAPLTAISFATADGASNGWAVGHDAIILASSDSGRTWSRQFQGENREESFLDVLALDARHVIAIGDNSLFLETRDGGAAWTRRKIIRDESHFNRITRGPTGTLYLAGERGTLLRSTDTGDSWTSIRAPYEGSFYGILPLDQHTLLAYGLIGHVFRSTDDGASWQQIATPHPVLLATAVKLKSNQILLAGSAGTLLLSRDDGKSLAPIPATTARAIAELVELPDGRILALGEAGATVLARPQ